MDESTPETLDAQFAVAGHVAFRAGPGGLVLAAIHNAYATAEIALQGAQVLAFQPVGTEPVLFVSTRAIYAPGRAIRGGIPICWPWFGPHPADATQPQHGFVRTLPWAVRATRGRADGAIEVRLGLRDTTSTRAVWPHPFELTLTVEVGRELCLALEMANPGDQPVPVTEALHAYFQIGSIAAVVVRGLEATRYIDKVAHGQRTVQAGPVTMRGETDRVYVDTAAACVIDDPTLGRRIQITKEGSHSTVIWNPGSAKARGMADFGGDEYTRMICVEAANALENGLVLEPGAEHRLAMAIRVEPIGAQG